MPKSSMLSLKPCACRPSMPASASALLVRMALSVISMLIKAGGQPTSAISWLVSVATSLLMNWRPERLTLTMGVLEASGPGQGLTAGLAQDEAADIEDQQVSSASGMKRFGGTIPCCG